MNDFLIFALLAAAIDLLGSANYIRDVLSRRTKPHVFSWFVWCVLMSIGAAVSVSEGAWAGAISLGVGAGINATICVLGLRFGGNQYIDKSDWLALFCAIASIPLWLITRDALWAALMITGINISGCYPTFRKAWVLPHDENLRSFSLFTVASVFRLMSVSPFLVTTVLYPATIALTNAILASLIVLRRQKAQRESGALVQEGVPDAL